MPLFDDRGRVNIVDAALLVVLIILLPAAYGSYLLFRDPTPVLTSVQPPSLPQAPDWQVEIRGAYFRPYLRVTFNGIQGKTFLFVNPTTAVVPLPELPAGIYDVVLFDYQREVAKLPRAFTVEPAVTARVELDGVLEWITQAQIESVRSGSAFGTGSSRVEFIAVEPPRPATLQVAIGQKMVALPAANGQQELPARIRTTCALQPAPDGTSRCAINGVAVQPGVSVRFSDGQTTMNFRVRDVETMERK